MIATCSLLAAAMLPGDEQILLLLLIIIMFLNANELSLLVFLFTKLVVLHFESCLGDLSLGGEGGDGGTWRGEEEIFVEEDFFKEFRLSSKDGLRILLQQFGWRTGLPLMWDTSLLIPCGLLDFEEHIFFFFNGREGKKARKI